MAKTQQFKIDATRPFYAVVGATDLAVELARTTATDVQSRFAKVELEPKALRDQAVTIVSARTEELTKDAKSAQARVEALLAELQAEVKALPAKAQARVNELVAELGEAVSDFNETYAELAARGKGLVTRIRKQEATQQTKAAAKTTATKARTTGTQAKKSAAKTTKAASSTAKKSSAPAKRSAKATGTAAKKTASSAAQATADAADKTGA